MVAIIMLSQIEKGNLTPSKVRSKVVDLILLIQIFPLVPSCVTNFVMATRGVSETVRKLSEAIGSRCTTYESIS